MPGDLLTIHSTIQCTHGGRVVLTTANSRTSAQQGLVLLETDIHPVAGCTFSVGNKYSPCVRIEWSAGASRVKVNGTPVLVQSSLGKCINAEGAIQGVAIVASTQMKVSAQ